MNPRGPRVELFKGAGKLPFNNWYLRGVATNGEPLWVSEAYFSKWNAKRAYRRSYAQHPLVDLTARPYRKYGG